MNKIDTSKWGPFKVGDLFRIKRPKPRIQNQYAPGSVAYVASGLYNNGVAAYLEPKDSRDIDKGNCISISPVNGSSFYQKSDFLGRGGSGGSVILLYNSNLTERNALFICTVLKSVATKYGYLDMLNGKNLRNLVIYLPITSADNPDWKYMENYIKRIEKKVNGSLTKMQKVTTG